MQDDLDADFRALPRLLCQQRDSDNFPVCEHHLLAEHSAASVCARILHASTKWLYRDIATSIEDILCRNCSAQNMCQSV